MPGNLRLLSLTFSLALLTISSLARAAEPERLDLVTCGRLLAWADLDKDEPVPLTKVIDLPAGMRAIGIAWDEDRDVQEIRLQCGNAAGPGELRVQYWFSTWPPDPPKKDSIEDPADDIWQGRWLTAQTRQDRHGNSVVLTFAPLHMKENERADNLPGVSYRRTLKARVVLPSSAPDVESLQMFSQTMLKPLDLRIELGCGDSRDAVWEGHVEISNGRLLTAEPWRFQKDESFALPAKWSNVRFGDGQTRGIIARILAAEPSPPGSNDITVVTVRASARIGGKQEPRTFSFSTLDLQHGPIYIPALHAYITRADDPKDFAAAGFTRGQKIRDRIPLEPEQTFERASREIPPLDPWKRQHGDIVYLPVAADANWQKFAVEYGGHVFISKIYAKVKNPELRRLRWNNDLIRFSIGTGETPSYREDHKVQVSIAREYLPIILNRWEQDGLTFQEEAFATLLSGPLDPTDPARSEQTPAVLMMRITARNDGTAARAAHVWFNIKPSGGLKLEQGRVYDEEGNFLLAAVLPPADASLATADGPKTDERGHGVVSRFDVAAGGTATMDVHIPFVSDITGDDVGKLETLNHERERERVAQYWQNIIDRTTRFTLPEPKFNCLARSVVPHIHISTTKDPKSGLFMVPAASYKYQVYANECCFQTLLLDALGDTRRSAQYLRTLTELQGTRSFPGNYSGPYDGVFHGIKVDDATDYTASGYGLDHGTVLWTLARHYFYTRDAIWLKETLPHMLKAIEWIELQRQATKITNGDGRRMPEYGLLPAGRLEDNSDWGYWFAVNAYCVAGMVETAAAMRDIGHTAAVRIERQAQAYRDDLRAAVLRAAEQAPVTRMRDVTYSPYVPTRAYQRFRYFGPLRVQYYSRYNKPMITPPCYRLSATREVLYGPMILLNLGIFGPHEPIADWILDDWEDNQTLSSSGGFNVHGFTDDNLWFSQGGMVFQANLQNPILVYLMRGEAPSAIRGTYNALVSCLYPDINALAEEFRMWRYASGPFYKSPDESRFVNRVRDMLVLESGNELWLAAGAPRRWLVSRQGIQVDRINSIFGPVAFTLHAGDEPGTVLAHVVPPTRPTPDRVWLHVRLPEGQHIRDVQLNGQAWKMFDPARERVLIPTDRGPVDLVIGS